MPLNEENRLDYWSNGQVRCPHCDCEFEPGQEDMYDLYEEETHEVECPVCNREFLVNINTAIIFKYSTDDQEVEIGYEVK